MQNPVRDLPRAIAISCVMCLIIYVLTVVAFHTTLSTNEVLGSEAVAVTFANRLYGKGRGWLSYCEVVTVASTFPNPGGLHRDVV